MRDLVTWGAAVAFLLTALYAVTVRRELVVVGRSIGHISHDVSELRRTNDNLQLEVSRMRSPGPLTDRACEVGVALPSPESMGIGAAK